MGNFPKHIWHIQVKRKKDTKQQTATASENLLFGTGVPCHLTKASGLSSTFPRSLAPWVTLANTQDLSGPQLCSLCRQVCGSNALPVERAWQPRVKSDGTWLHHCLSSPASSPLNLTSRKGQPNSYHRKIWSLLYFLNCFQFPMGERDWFILLISKGLIFPPSVI